MKITLKKVFLKDIQRVAEPHKRDVKAFLEQLHANPKILETFSHAKKLQSSKKGDFYRIRFGEYRLGYERKEDEIVIYRILHRKEIYRYFP